MFIATAGGYLSQKPEKNAPFNIFTRPFKKIYYSHLIKKMGLTLPSQPINPAALHRIEVDSSFKTQKKGAPSEVVFVDKNLWEQLGLAPEFFAPNRRLEFFTKESWDKIQERNPASIAPDWKATIGFKCWAECAKLMLGLIDSLSMPTFSIMFKGLSQETPSYIISHELLHDIFYRLPPLTRIEFYNLGIRLLAEWNFNIDKNNNFSPSCENLFMERIFKKHITLQLLKDLVTPKAVFLPVDSASYASLSLRYLISELFVFSANEIFGTKDPSIRMVPPRPIINFMEKLRTEIQTGRVKIKKD